MPFIILDRDGVINHDSNEYIKSPEEFLAIPGSLAAIAQLNRAGFHVLIATNQSGIARGFFDLVTLDHIHKKLCHELASYGAFIKEFFFCPHHPDDGCYCRKPKPGLLEQIRNKYLLNLSETFFIGDSITDVQAAKAVACIPILVRTGKGQNTIEQHPELTTIPNFVDLAAAVDYVIFHHSVGKSK